MMLNNLSKHPSDIAKSAIEYLKTLNVSEKTKETYEDVFFLFIESLRSDSSAVIENEQGEYFLTNNWDAYYGGAISNFIDWWLPRKVMGSDTLQSKAPGILRKWITWCYKHRYFDEEHYQDFLDALPKGKSKEINRLQKAADLLCRVHTPNPGAWRTGDNKVVSLGRNKEPEDFYEGYMKIIRFEKESGHLENQEGKKIGPVVLGKELVKILKIGDIINVSIGKFGKYWKILESGNVYAEGTILQSLQNV